MQIGFSPYEFALRIIRRWWLIAGIMILGGGAGWILSNLHPAMYESKATLSSTIDYVQSGYLTDIEEDQILNNLGDILLSDEVITDLAARLSSSGYEISIDNLRTGLFIERQGYHWTMRARDENAQVARQVASTWAEVVEQKLNIYFEHAIKMAALYRKLIGLENCLSQQTWVEPASAPCSIIDSPKIRDEIEKVTRDLLIETRESRGIDPAVRFTITDRASAPIKVAFHKNEMIMVGMLIGLVSGILFYAFISHSRAH